MGNTRRGKTYTFNIINFIKPDSLYNEGMRVLLFSTKQTHSLGTGWRRDGTDICYFPNSIRKKPNSSNSYYTLSFRLTMDCRNTI